MYTPQDGPLLAVNLHGVSDLLYHIGKVAGFERGVGRRRLGIAVLAMSRQRLFSYFAYATYHRVALPDDDMVRSLDSVNVSRQVFLDLRLLARHPTVRS